MVDFVESFLDHLGQAGHDSRASYIDTATFDTQATSDFFDGDSFDGRHPEGLPIGGFELGFQLIGGPMEELFLVFGLEFGRGGDARVREVAQASVLSGGAYLFLLFFPEKVDGQVSRDAVEPASKGAIRSISVPILDGLGDAGENFLGDFGGVGVLEAVALQESLDDRLVDGDELRPGNMVTEIANSGDQAGSRFRFGVSHGNHGILGM